MMDKPELFVVRQDRQSAANPWLARWRTGQYYVFLSLEKILLFADAMKAKLVTFGSVGEARAFMDAHPEVHRRWQEAVICRVIVDGDTMSFEPIGEDE